MAKARTVFLCGQCGSSFAKWMGRCPDCGTWDSLESFRDDAIDDPHAGPVWGDDSPEPPTELPSRTRKPAGGKAGAKAASMRAPQAVAMSDIQADDDDVARIGSGLGELDRVLGGQGDRRGLVPGSAVLLGGEPGIGKSTLLLQAAAGWAAHGGAGADAPGTRVLYVSSEESARQVHGRAERLGLSASDALFVLPETNLTRIIEQARKVRPRVLLIDSIQMIYTPDVPASPGSVTQLRRCGSDLVRLAKSAGIAVILVGHVTKDGQIAGPRIVEHLVDAVLYFEGDRDHGVRTLRAIKNRFGATLEIGLFDMTGRGLEERPEGGGLTAQALGEPRPGSVVCPVLHGSRCLLVEVQALTATGFLGSARRRCSGLDTNRLAMLIAVLEQHAGLNLADRDIFASCVGGVRVTEPASDLALLLAIAGAHHRRALPAGTAAMGEVGLGGEVRPVAQIDARLAEAARMGYTRVLAPTPTGSKASRESLAASAKSAGIAIDAVASVGAAIGHLQ